MMAQSRNWSVGNVVYVEKACDVNLAELAAYYRAHPSAKVRRMLDDEGNEEVRAPKPAITNPLDIHVYTGPASTSTATYSGHEALTPHTAYLPASPAPADSFEAQTSDGTSIPPDTHGAVDSQYAVSALNDSIVVQNRATHSTVYAVQIDNFWASLETAHGAGAFDPRICYDPHYKRWIIAYDYGGQTTYNAMFVAVSATGDPTGTWHMYTINLASGSGTWMDFPTVGFNKRWFCLSGNYFNSSGSFTNDAVFVMDYASMMAGGTFSYQTITPGSSTGSFTLCPAEIYDTTEANMFLIENYNGGGGQLREWKITGTTIGSLTLTSVGYPTTTTFWQSSAPGGGADFGPELGTTHKVQCNDDRVNNVKMRNGKLWCAHTGFLPATGSPTRASAFWWQIDTLANPLQVGVIDDATAANFYFFPSVAVNVNNDALIGFAHASTSIHPSASYALHLNSDAASSWRPVFTYRHGVLPYYQTFGGSQCRWGDYSAACVDPRNSTDFWTLQESVPNYSGGISSSTWDTWWAYVPVCNALSAPTAGITPTTPCQGTTQLFSVTPSTGATSYTWTVTGTGWSGTSTTDSANLTVGSGIGTVSVVANSACSTSVAYTFTVAPAPLPGTPTVTLPSPLPCVGATGTTTLSAVATGATTFNWSVSGTGWSGTSTTATINPTIGTSTGTFVVSGVNACGAGAATTVTITPSSGAPTPTIALSGATPCPGATSATYVATSAGATSFTWTVLGTGWSGSTTTATINVTVGTGSGTIICKATGSCGTSAPDTLIANTAAAPPVPVITAPAAPCPGATGVYTATSTGATTFNWSVSGTGWSGSSATSTINVTAGTAVGSLVVSATDACGTSAATTLNVTPSSGPTLPSISGSAPCSGATSAVFTAASTGATSFTWTVLGTGWSGSSTTATITVNVGSGSGTIIVKGSNSCGTSSPDTLVVAPGTLPGATTVTPPATLPCSGVVTYTASSSGATSYTWNVSGTAYSGSSTTNSLNLTIGTGVGRIIVCGTNACGNGPNDTVTVAPATPPSLPVISLGSSLPCSGGAGSATYTASSSGAVSYVWTVLGTGWSGSSTTSSIVVTMGSGTGTLICSGQNVCGTGSADTVYVDNSGLPNTPSLSLISAVPCPATGTATYFANSVGALSYNWSVFGTGWSGTSATDSLTLTVGTGTVMLVCSGTNECGTGANDTAYLTPNSLTGSASAILATTPICEGNIATFITSAVSSATSYVWVVTGTGWSGSSSTTLFSCTVGTGPATITVYGAGICGAGLSYSLFDVVPTAIPTASFTVASHIVNIGVNDLVTYTGTPSAMGTYSWNFAGGTASPGSGAGPNWVNWTAPGLKTITLSVTDSGCSSTVFSDTVLVVVPTQTESLNSENSSVLLVPNPNLGSFNVVFGAEVKGSVFVRLFDENGRQVYSEIFEGVKDNMIEVNSGNLPNGFYTATIVTDNNVVNKKVIISK